MCRQECGAERTAIVLPACSGSKRANGYLWRRTGTGRVPHAGRFAGPRRGAPRRLDPAEGEPNWPLAYPRRTDNRPDRLARNAHEIHKMGWWRTGRTGLIEERVLGRGEKCSGCCREEKSRGELVRPVRHHLPGRPHVQLLGLAVGVEWVTLAGRGGREDTQTTTPRPKPGRVESDLVRA